MKINLKLTIIVSFLLLSIQSCSTSSGAKPGSKPTKDVSSETLEGFDADKVKSVYLMPVLVEDIGTQSLGVPSVQATDSLMTALEVYTQLEVSGGTSKKQQKDWSGILSKGDATQLSQLGTSKERLFKIAQQISKEEGGSPVILCLLQKSADRTGGGLGAEVPAQAKYRIWLYDGQVDKIVWTSAYSTKEEAVTENLFSLGTREAVSFSSLNDLISSGFRGSAKSLDKLLRKKTSSK